MIEDIRPRSMISNSEGGVDFVVGQKQERKPQRSKLSHQRGGSIPKGDIAEQLRVLTGGENAEDIAASINGEKNNEEKQAEEIPTPQEVADKLSSLTKDETEEAKSLIDEAVRLGYLHLDKKGRPVAQDLENQVIIMAESQRLNTEKPDNEIEVGKVIPGAEKEDVQAKSTKVESKKETGNAEEGELVELKAVESKAGSRMVKAQIEIAKAEEKIQVIEAYKEKLRKEDKFSDAILEIERQKAELLAAVIPDEEEISRVEKHTELSLKIIEIMGQEGLAKIEFQELLEAEKVANDELENALKELEAAEIDEALTLLGKIDIQHNYLDSEIISIASQPNTSLIVLLGLAKGISKETVERVQAFVEQGDKEKAIDSIRDELYSNYFKGKESADAETNYKKALSPDTTVLELIRLIDDEELKKEVTLALKNNVISISTSGEIISNIENQEGNVDYVEDLKERLLDTLRDEYQEEIYTTLTDDFKKNDQIYLGFSEKIKELRDQVRGQEIFSGRVEKIRLYLYNREKFNEMTKVQEAERETQSLIDQRENYLKRHKDMFEKTADFRLEIFEKISEDDFGMLDAFEYQEYTKNLISEEDSLREDDLIYLKKSGLDIKIKEKEIKVPYLVSELAEKFTKAEKIDIAKKYADSIKDFIQENSGIQLTDQEFQAFLVRSSAFDELKDLAVLAEGIPKFMHEHADRHDFSTEKIRFALREYIQTDVMLEKLKTIILKEFSNEWSKTRFSKFVDDGLFLQEFVRGFDFSKEEEANLVESVQGIFEEGGLEMAENSRKSLSQIEVPNEPSFNDSGESSMSEVNARSQMFSSLNYSAEGLSRVKNRKGRKIGILSDLKSGLLSLFGGGK